MSTPKTHPLRQALDQAAMGSPPDDDEIAGLVEALSLDAKAAAQLADAIDRVASLRAQGDRGLARAEAGNAAAGLIAVAGAYRRPGRVSDDENDPRKLAAAVLGDRRTDEDREILSRIPRG